MMLGSFDKRMVLFWLPFYAYEVVASLDATPTENAITFLPLKGYNDLLECALSSDGIAFSYTKASNKETVILAECKRDAKSCTLRSHDNYAVSKTPNGGVLEILNLSEETYGNYTCFQISQRENAVDIYVGYSDETQSNAVKFKPVLGRKDVLECELNNSISFKYKNASSGKENVIAECVHNLLCYVSYNNNFKARKTMTGGILVIKKLTKETEGIFTCFETNNKENEVQIRVRMSEETEPIRPTSTLATDASTKTSDDTSNTGLIIVSVYAGVITVLLILLTTYITYKKCWRPYYRTKKDEDTRIVMDVTQQVKTLKIDLATRDNEIVDLKMKVVTLTNQQSEHQQNINELKDQIKSKDQQLSTFNADYEHDNETSFIAEKQDGNEEERTLLLDRGINVPI